MYVTFRIQWSHSLIMETSTLGTWSIPALASTWQPTRCPPGNWLARGQGLGLISVADVPDKGAAPAHHPPPPPPMCENCKGGGAVRSNTSFPTCFLTTIKTATREEKIGFSNFCLYDGVFDISNSWSVYEANIRFVGV